MKKYLSFFLSVLAALALFFIQGWQDKVEAASSCCPGGQFADCTITISPCDIGGEFTNIDIDINVNTANPVRINLTSDLDLAGSNIDFRNKAGGANKEVVIDGRAPASTNGINGKNIDMTGGDIYYPQGGLTIDLSVPNTSTGNGGNLDITGTSGYSFFPGNSSLKIYTNGSNYSGGPVRIGGDVDIAFTSDTLLSSMSLIKTGNFAMPLVDGGRVDLTGSGGIGIESSVNLISTSSSRKAGDVKITGSGYFKGGIHANSCQGYGACGEQGGYIDLTGLEKFYAADCGLVSLEAKKGGTIDFTGSGFVDLSATTTTGAGEGGTLKITGSTLSDCTCLSGGGACWNQLNINNDTVDFTGVDCDETDSIAACPIRVPTVSDVNSPEPDGYYRAGDIVDITVQFNISVVVTGTPTLELETGAVNRKVNYLNGSGTDKLTFRYIVQAGDASDDLDYTGTNSIGLSGGATIKNTLGTNNANLTLPTPGSQHSLGYNKDIIIDTQAPTTSVSAYDKNDNAITNGSSIAQANVITTKFRAVASDNKGVYMNVVKWTNNDWVSTNQVNCGNATNCWVRIDTVPVSYSTNGTSWTSCTSSPICTITNQPGPFTSGTVKYRSESADAAFNTTVTGDRTFSITVPPTPTPTATPTPTPTATASASPTPSTSASPTPTITASPTPTASVTPTPTATPTASPSPTTTPTASPTPTATASPTPTPVPNNPPVVSNLKTNASLLNYCVQPLTAIIFSWKFTDTEDGTTQTAYQFVITRTDDGAIYNTGKVTGVAGSATSITGVSINTSSPGFINFKHSYTWTVKVWDSQDASDGPDAGPGYSTPDHKYPDVNFVCSPSDTSCPSNHAAFEEIIFTDNSTCYDTNNNITACTSWTWDFCKGTTCSDKTDNGETVTHTYDSVAGTYLVDLLVSDGVYSCRVQPPKPINALKQRWKEIVPD